MQTQTSPAGEKNYGPDFAEVRAAAQERWPEIINALAPALHDALDRAPKNVPCPVHGGKDGFRFFKDYRDTGGGVCNTCGAMADGFSLLAWVQAWSIKETFAEVAAYLGIANQRSTTCTVTYREPVKAEPPKPNEDQRQRLNRAWLESFAITSVEAEPLRRYLLNRGVLPKTLPTSLRFHPGLPYFVEKDGKWKKLGDLPAMIARVSDAEGKPVTLHRTFITQSGKKSPVPSQKKLMGAATEGTITGGAIRLGEATHWVGLTEGIETALAVHCATGMPVWACVSTTLLERVVIPETVKQVVIWADSDANDAGKNAADKLLKRLHDAGRSARVFYPAEVHPEKKTDIDWADLYLAHGASLFPKL
jgi:phage/plasmid primase-like uncharacterized protein